MPAKLYSAALQGIYAKIVEVECDLAPGLFSFNIVGLPDTAVKESKDRISAALKNSGAASPTQRNKRITVNLAPADLKKEGPSYDLPIALSYLLASEQTKFDPKGKLFVGELALDGNIRRVNGILSVVMEARDRGLKSVFVPAENAGEAAMIKNIEIIGADNLNQLLKHFEGKELIKPTKEHMRKIRKEIPDYDMTNIKGQEQAKRMLEIAVAGGHNVFLKGPPGAGKTLLSRSLASIMPALSTGEMLEITRIFSAAGLLNSDNPLVTKRPFRCPHHTVSRMGLVGGGSKIAPGEVTLAHRGVLFLDEFNEFPRSVLEALRQPLEDGYVTIGRALGRVRYPAQFMLVASANPCPCGYLNHPKKPCICSPREIQKYRKRASGPILDRIDLHVEVPAVEIDDLAQERQAVKQGEPSSSIQERIKLARNIQHERFAKDAIQVNAEMKNAHLKQYAHLSSEVERILRQAAKRFQLSARSYFRMQKISRTIADLEGVEDITVAHMAEALQYRPKIHDEE